MDRQDVTSSCLRSVGYDAKGKVLELEFHGGGIYRYEGVPKRVFDELMIAESLGRYFIAEIRDCYRTSRLG